MNTWLKKMMVALLALGIGQAAWADDVPNLKKIVQRAEAGEADVQVILGSMYLRGIGVRQSDQEAVRWYLKAAEQGFSPAQNRLGEMYEEGQGVPKNRKVAKEWHKKACANGFQDGCNDYRKLNNEGH